MIPLVFVMVGRPGFPYSGRSYGNGRDEDFRRESRERPVETDDAVYDVIDDNIKLARKINRKTEGGRGFDRYMDDYELREYGAGSDKVPPTSRFSGLDIDRMKQEGRERGLTKRETAAAIFQYADDMLDKTSMGGTTADKLGNLAKLLMKSDKNGAGGKGDGGNNGGDQGGDDGDQGENERDVRRGMNFVLESALLQGDDKLADWAKQNYGFFAPINRDRADVFRGTQYMGPEPPIREIPEGTTGYQDRFYDEDMNPDYADPDDVTDAGLSYRDAQLLDAANLLDSLKREYGVVL